MTPARARLTLFGMIALFVLTAGNALFLQERPHGLQPPGLPSTQLSLTQFPPETPAVKAAPNAFVPVENQDRVQSALQRELANRGYLEQLQVQGDGLRLAVLAYEFDAGLPLRGEPDRPLLTHVLFDLNQAPKGVFVDRAEANAHLVRAVQKTLLSLGFSSGTLSGRMDLLTTSAVKAFQRHRNIEPSGRLSELTLLNLVTYTGQPLNFSED